MQLTAFERRVASHTGLDAARALYRQGRYQEARLECEAIAETSEETAVRFAAVLFVAVIQSETHRYTDCLNTLKRIGPEVDQMPADLKGKFYGQRAFAYKKLERQDRALVDYEAARFWLQEAGDVIGIASVRNNLAMVYAKSGRFEDAVIESDAAIDLVQDPRQQIMLGRCYDQRAQILNHQEQFSEAAEWGKRSLELLGSHPASDEARVTYGRALVGIGASLMRDGDPIGLFYSRRVAARPLKTALTKEIAQLALERSEGNVLLASKLLNVTHQSLQSFINDNDLTSSQRRKVRRSIIRK